jgi:pyruvate dehydrogenase E2 component (dihydrolipoamide acetyltransferase)
MATSIVIPREGQSMESAVIVKWLVEVGDKVDFAQPICEVESEKAVFEIESPVEGTLLEIYYKEGDTAPVLKAIAVVGKPGEDYGELKPENSEAESLDAKAQTTEEKTAVETTPKKTQKEENMTAKILMSPRAKKLLRDKNIDPKLLNIKLIKEQDVVDYLESKPKLTPAATDLNNKIGGKLPTLGTGIGGRITVDDLNNVEKTDSGVVISGMRKTIADKMHQSLQQTAQFTLNSYADATNLLKYRKQLKESGLALEKISINDILLFVVAKALADYPQINAHFENGMLTAKQQVNLGFAVEVTDGLMVPVINKADTLSLKQISENANRLATACKSGSVNPSDMKNGTFTVSNLGALGIDTFTPILNYPQVGILGVGAISPRPIIKDNVVEFVDQIALSLTVNHQVIDGAVGARFLKLISSYIENIDTLLAL